MRRDDHRYRVYERERTRSGHHTKNAHIRLSEFSGLIQIDRVKSVCARRENSRTENIFL